MLDGVYQRKPCSLDHFQTVWAAKHDISLVSCYLRSARRFCGSSINEKLRCIKPLPSLTLALPAIITNYRKTYSLMHPNDVLCFATVLSTEMEEGRILGNKTREPVLILSLNQTHKKKKKQG